MNETQVAFTLHVSDVVQTNKVLVPKELGCRKTLGFREADMRQTALLICLIIVR